MPTGTAQEEITVERRMTVKGWKMEDGRRREFSVTSPLYSDSTVDYEQKRIGEYVQFSWQPHITEVIVERRYVTPWTIADFKEDT